MNEVMDLWIGRRTDCHAFACSFALPKSEFDQSIAPVKVVNFQSLPVGLYFKK